MLYRNFSDQASLDAEYNPLSTAGDAGDIVKRWEERSAHARKHLNTHLGVRFGPTADEYMDIFPSDKPSGGLHLFIHGGYWRRFTAREFSFVAPTLVESGVSVAVMNYALCPEVTVGEIVRQTRSAIYWLKENESKYGIDARHLTISGHSAGGHLLAMALNSDWESTYNLDHDVIAGACAISGIYDLSPLPYSYLQPQIQLTWADVKYLSPIQHIPDRAPPLTVVVGGHETSEFIRQSRDFFTAWQTKGLTGNWLNIEDAHHFNILDGFEDSRSILFQAIFNIATL